MELTIDPQVRAAAPLLKIIVMEADVKNAPTSDELWTEICAEAARMSEMPMASINKQPAIAATRAAYKALGKEPNRYRPSAEALCRRCVKGQELYRSLAVIDLINLLSIQTGHSIGGFDADKVQEPLTLGVGVEGEPYEAIHRGQLNIANMPVIRERIGGIGTPTSDNERTKLTESTTHLLMTINLYSGGGDTAPEEIARRAADMLERYAEGKNITYTIV